MTEYKPMLATLGTEDDLNKKGFIFEPKLDGWRALCFVNSKLKFYSRNGNDLTADFPELKFRGQVCADNAVLDGEIVIYDENGKPNFQLIQNRKLISRFPATFVVFDILMKDNKNLTNVPLIERKQVLHSTVMENGGIQVVVFTKDGKKLWDVARERELEGIIAKKETSIYSPKRSRDWIKIKRTKTADCVILGYTTERKSLSALLLGAYSNGLLTFIGKVGTGFNERNTREILEKFAEIERSTAPAQIGREKAHWLAPVLVCEVKYSERTNDGKLRAPVFISLREDKSPEECRLEDIQ